MRRIAVALALACVVLTACAGQSASAPTPTTASSSIAVSTAKSTTSASKPSTSKPTLPTTTAAPVPVNFSIKCYTGNDYATYQQAWAGKHTNYDCYETKKSGTEYTPQQLEAYKVGFDPIQGIDMDFRLGELYEMCASFGDVSVGGYFIYKEDQARQAMADLILCPDHPDAATIQASIDKFHGSQAAASSNRADSTGHSDTELSNNSAKTSAGFFHPSVLRGRSLSSSATLSRSAWVCNDRSVPFGK